MASSIPEITLIGHPFAPIGMGEVLRSIFRSFQAVGISPKVLDVYGIFSPDDESHADLTKALVADFGKVNIFCLNGDEISSSLTHLNRELPTDSLNVVYPMWELPRYPKEWAEQLERFDEVWAGSKFIQSALTTSVKSPVVHLPLPGEIKLGKIYGRRHFNLPEDAFLFLFHFDYTSYMARKNPLGVLQAFKEICLSKPLADTMLIIKCKGGELDSADRREVASQIAAEENVICIDRLLDEVEIKSLLWCCDAFVSLHRSEGFGFGLSNAMFLGKPVIATGYSGNMDYMNSTNALLVNYSLRPVTPNTYPFWKDQVWADPDPSHAAKLMLQAVSDLALCRTVGGFARRHIRSRFSYQSRGLAFCSRIQELQGNLG